MSAPAPPDLPDMNSGPRNFVTTDQDHGGIALTIATLMSTWTILCFFVRVYMRATVSGPFGLDDFLCSVATIFGIIQMVTSSAAISFGFGKALVLLTEAQILRASQALYAAQLLYIVTITLTKCTVALLLARIVFIKSRVYACYGILGLSCIWGLASFLTQAIRCTEYQPWIIIGDHTCGSTLIAWEVITAFNVAIEVLIFAMPVWLVWDLQTDLSKKVTVVLVFSMRLPVIVAALFRIHYLLQGSKSTDPLLHGVIPFICMNIEMHYGLISATIPTLKPFVGAFNTGWGTYDSQGLSGYGQGSSGGGAAGGGGSYAMQSIGSRRAARNNASHSQHSASGHDGGEKRSTYGKNITHVRSARSPDGKRTRTNSDDSQQMIIHQTYTTEIHVEGGDGPMHMPPSRGGDSLDWESRPTLPPS